MIKIVKISIILLIIQFACSIKIVAQPNFETAIAYNDFIVIEQQKLANVIASLGNSMEKGSESEIFAYIEEMKATINESIAKLEAMTAFNGNSEFIVASISLFNFYKLVATTYYPEIVKIALKETLTNDDQLKLNELVENITTKEKYYDEQFLTAQKKFAEANNFQIGTVTTTEETKTDYKNPTVQNDLPSELNQFVTNFLGLMKENNQIELKSKISPIYLENNRLVNSDFKINSYTITGFKVFGYQLEENLVVVNIWNENETWVHQLTFKIVQSKGNLYIEPGAISGLWIDPWWKATLRINEKK